MEFDMVVEIPQGERNKYEMDLDKGRIRLDRTLFTATAYPCEYGFIPDTLAEDGDPLDAMVLVDQPTFPGCVISVRPIAVFWMRDEHGPDAKIFCAPSGDLRKENLRDLADVPDHVLLEISHFFDVYKDLEPGKESESRGWQSRAAAEEVCREARRRWQENRDLSPGRHGS